MALTTSYMPPGLQAVILAGGLGSRLAEETHLRPKPMVEIGGKPILWHILRFTATMVLMILLFVAATRGM